MEDTSRRPAKQIRKKLYEGKRMSQPAFHRAYDAMPYDYKAELIAGVVCEPSPLGWEHGESDGRLNYLLQGYAIGTPGVQAATNVTVILSNKDEVQPDIVLRIKPEYCGQSQNVSLPSLRVQPRATYVKGAPELVAEVASSSRAVDLGIKKDRYRLSGVREYFVLCLHPKRVYWFELQTGAEIRADKDGVYRSNIFPGLWIHGTALLDLVGNLSMRTLDHGLNSDEHLDFVRKLSQCKAV